MEESAQKIQREKTIYEIFTKNQHPNIVHAILLIPEGIFMERLEATLDTRLSELSAISSTVKYRWIRQLVSAVTWIEGLGYVHGDLRPANILLDSQDNIRVGDFDATVQRGEELLVASEPYCKLNAKFELPLAGPQTEQFALGSCIYAMRFGHKPFHHLDPPARVQKLTKNEFPPTSSDNLFGEVMNKCWHGKYGSIRAVQEDVVAIIGEDHALYDGIRNDVVRSLLEECEEYLAKASKTIGK